MPDFIIHHLQLAKAGEASQSPDQKVIDELTRNAMFSGEVSGALEHDLYQPIAIVRCSEIRETFRITNHIDHDWTTNPEVIHASENQRSTSVGDIAVDLDAGKAWACQSTGWGGIEDAAQVAALIEASKNFLQEASASAASPH